MPEGFTTPPIVPKIAPVVSLDKADADRQKTYGDLARADAELKATLPLGDEVPEPAPAPIEEPMWVASDVKWTDEDKQAFVRALFGNRQFEKRYVLFGELEASFVDRTPEQSESLYRQLEIDSESSVIRTETDEQWAVWLERYQLAGNLREVKTKTSGTQSFPPTDKLNDRVKELMKLPKPLYQALMQTSRNFEALVNELTRRAQDSDFWKTAGSSSRRKPPAAEQ